MLTCLNFSDLQSVLHLMQYTYWDFFTHCLKQFLNYQFWCFLIPLLFFVSCLPYPLAKHFCLRNFHPGEKNCFGQDLVNMEGGAPGHTVFDKKLLNTQQGVGRYTRKSLIMKWAKELKVFQKKFTEAEPSLSQQCQLVHWYRWVPRILT